MCHSPFDLDDDGLICEDCADKVAAKRSETSFQLMAKQMAAMQASINELRKDKKSSSSSSSRSSKKSPAQAQDKGQPEPRASTSTDRAEDIVPDPRNPPAPSTPNRPPKGTPPRKDRSKSPDRSEDEDLGSDMEDSGARQSRFLLKPEESEILLRAIYITLNLEKEKEELSLHDSWYDNLSQKQFRTFPFHKNLKEMVDREWKTPESRTVFSGSLKRRYPFKEEEMAWTKMPKLDAAVAKASSSTELAFEGVGSLKDPMDKKVDTLMKKAWEACVTGLRALAAANCVSRGLKFWLDQLQLHLENNTPRADILKNIPVLKTSALFLADAVLEGFRTMVKAMATQNSARRAVWIKTWKDGDATSRANICSIPFSGDLVFGPELEKILEHNADKKKGFPVKKKPYVGPGKRNFFRKTGDNKNYRPQAGKNRWNQKRRQGSSLLFTPAKNPPKSPKSK